MVRYWRAAAWLMAAYGAMGAHAMEQESRNALSPVAGATWKFEGIVGDRVEANVDQWLLRAPDANPGMIDMFRRRETVLETNPVPWIGEFAGKYLISAVQACRMSDDPRLEPYVRAFVDELLACQDADGYFGPFPHDERLRGHWDLWGNYHVMLGLLMWSDHADDARAAEAAGRAAEFACTVYLDGELRPIDAATPEMNLAILHVLGLLHRRNGEPRTLALMERIAEDMEKAGDWFRKGVEGVPYYRLPSNGWRWESLHTVQGLAELYRITGDERYKAAVVNLWDSIRKHDRHPSGAFSTHERAIGTPYAEGSIETCCSVAWLALTADVLALTGDARAADELEMTTWNQVLAAQHPSGGWCTYNTPLDGVRKPAFHDINFQWRPGYPELNCCSVNAPRGLGMLSEWGVMQQGKVVAFNFYGPLEATFALESGKTLTVRQETQFPVSGNVRIVLSPSKRMPLNLWLRIPGWSRETRASINGKPVGNRTAGRYIGLSGIYGKGDIIDLSFDMRPWYWAGDGDRAGHAAIYRGPLLLAYDTRFNDAKEPPAIDVSKLGLTPADVPVNADAIGLWKTTAADGSEVLLCDFASAGAAGTEYVSWLPCVNAGPPPVWLLEPRADGTAPASGARFRWTSYGATDTGYTLEIARDDAFVDVVHAESDLRGRQWLSPVALDDGAEYYWRVTARNDYGQLENLPGPQRFTADAALPPHPAAQAGPGGLLLDAPLTADANPAVGAVDIAESVAFTPDGAEFDGESSALRYAIGPFPDEDYTLVAWFRPDDLARPGMQQVFSAWCAAADDPLRITIEDGGVSARIEAGAFHSTKAVPLSQGEWVQVAAIKNGARLSLYVNGETADGVAAPFVLTTAAENAGIGYNPFYEGGERFKGAIRGVKLYGRALAAEEVREDFRKR